MTRDREQSLEMLSNLGPGKGKDFDNSNPVGPCITTADEIPDPYALEMVVRAAQAGWRIAETDVPYYPRTGKSKVTGTLGGTVRTVRDMRRVLATVASPASS